MKRLVRVALVVGMALTVLCVPPQNSQASQPISDLLSIRIDKAGCVWWHETRASRENLPKPLFADIESDSVSDCSLDYPTLYALLEDYIGRLRTAHILVIVHPETHYMRLNNFLAVVDDIDTQRVNDIDSLISIKKDLLAAATGDEEMQLHRELRALERDKVCGPMVALGFWGARDDRIFQFMEDSTGVSGPPASHVPKKNQFLERYQSGHWEERFPDSLTMGAGPPRPVLPKDVIPSPIRQGVVVEFADSLATAPRHE